MRAVNSLFAVGVMGLLMMSGNVMADTDSAPDHFFANASTISEDVIKTRFATGDTDWAPDHKFVTVADISENMNQTHSQLAAAEFSVDYVEIPSYRADIDETVKASNRSIADGATDF